MKITYKQELTDPQHPIMHGDTPFAKEFNKRQEQIWKDGVFDKFDYEQVTIVMLEILIADYDKRHAPRKRKEEPT